MFCLAGLKVVFYPRLLFADLHSIWFLFFMAMLHTNR
jgi:hypothetical protein